MSVANSFNNLTIRTKVSVTFGILVIAVIALAGTSILRVSMINDRAADVRDNWLPSTGTLGQMEAALQNFRVSEARVALADESHRPAEMDLLQERRGQIEALRTQYEPLISPNTEDSRLMAQFDKAWSEHKTALIANLGADSGNARGCSSPPSARASSPPRSCWNKTSPSINNRASSQRMPGRRSTEAPARS